METERESLTLNDMDPNTSYKKTILVVDDDESVLSFLSFSLKGEGFNIIEAKSAEQSLLKIKSAKIDLFLIDIMLPGMDGFNLCKTIRSNEAVHNIPVLFITAYADPKSLQNTKEAGAQGLIEKPITFTQLLVQVNDALAGRFTVPSRIKFAA